MADRRDPVRVLELRSVRGTGGGPDKTILLGALGHDPSRTRVTVCYLRDARDEIYHIDERAAGFGVDYLEITERHSFDRTIWPRLLRVVRSRGIDVVHSHDYKTDLLAWLLARATRVPVMSTVHGWSGRSFRERNIYYPAHKRLLARFPTVVTVSGRLRRELIARGARPERVTVLLNGIDPERYRRDPAKVAAARAAYDLAPDAIAIGSVGRLEQEKRFDVFIEGFARGFERNRRLRLLIAGDGSRRAALAGLAERLGVTPACRFVGHQHDVRQVHHALDLFVQSSETEGTPNAVLEAMALETPIVATKAGGTDEVCRDGIDGLLVPINDPEALAAGIQDALANPEARAARTRRARLQVETTLSFANRLRALESIYASLAPAGSRS